MAQPAPGKVAATDRLQRKRGSAPASSEPAPTVTGPEPAAADDPFLLHLPAVQRRAASEALLGVVPVHEIAARGVAGAGGELPHLDRIQASFGPGHDVSHVRAHVGGDGATAAKAIGAEAFATGDQVAFQRAPDLHTAAHEAAHVVQQAQGVQLAGGVGTDGDAHERHADAVADRVVAGGSSADLLTGHGGGAASAAVQLRRMPANVGALLGDPADPSKPGPNFDANVEGMLLLIERAISDPPFTADELAQARTLILGGKTPVEFLLTTPAPVMLTKIADAIRTIRPGQTLGDPALIDVGPRTGTDDTKHLARLIENAKKVFDPIISGGHNHGLREVFGPSHRVEAQDKYRQGRDFMLKLAHDNKILTDRSGFAGEVSLGGLTRFQTRISIAPDIIDQPDQPESVIIMIHESMHAGNSDVKDKGYIGTASFTKLPEDVKLTNAAHFEVVPRRILHVEPTFDGVSFVPAGTSVGGVTEPPLTATQQAGRDASEVLRKAWARGLNMHRLYVELYKDPAQWTADRGGGKTFATSLPFWSKVEKLTIHRKTDIDPAAANEAQHPVSQIDLALHEGLIRKLAAAMEALPPEEADVTAFEAAHSTDEERTAAHASADLYRDFLIRLIVKLPVTQPMTGGPERDVRVIAQMAAVTADEVLNPRSPDDFAD